MRAHRVLVLLAIAMGASAQTVHRSPETPKFLGREVVLYEPAMKDEPGVFPAGPAKVCIEGPPQEQCYTMPDDFGWNLKVKVEEILKGVSILFFSANSGGVSGFGVHVALLVPSGGNTLFPGGGKSLENALAGDVLLTNQSQTDFWSEPDLSDSKIFVTADYLQGPEEGHYGEHRYVISAYVWDGGFYWLADRFATSHWYDLEKADVLGSERREIVARLKKVVPAIRQRNQY
jgi:hypothetical protein